VVLRDVYGLSIEEIARELKITETAAKVRVHRARKKLKETLHPTGEER
jgi:DNA-directed RNA polymerase specialized sigma24 family protein